MITPSSSLGGVTGDAIRIRADAVDVMSIGLSGMWVKGGLVVDGNIGCTVLSSYGMVVGSYFESNGVTVINGGLHKTGEKSYSASHGGSSPAVGGVIDAGTTVTTINVGPSSTSNHYFRLSAGFEGQEVYIHNTDASQTAAQIFDSAGSKFIAIINYREIALLRFWKTRWRLI
jgi:hypothetical protein